MLDARNAFETADGDDEIYWGAYVGSADEILISGRVADVAEEIIAAREAARERHGWIMDTYLLRRTGDDGRMSQPAEPDRAGPTATVLILGGTCGGAPARWAAGRHRRSAHDLVAGRAGQESGAANWGSPDRRVRRRQRTGRLAERPTRGRRHRRHSSIRRRHLGERRRRVRADRDAAAQPGAAALDGRSAGHLARRRGTGGRRADAAAARGAGLSDHRAAGAGRVRVPRSDVVPDPLRGPAVRPAAACR